MTLSKRFTGWGIGLKRSSAGNAKSPFHTLYWRLLLSYLGTMSAVVGIFTIVVYEVVARTLYVQFDQQLITLANAAAHNLKAISSKQTAQNRLPVTVDNDGDLDLPWQDLQDNDESVEWFDTQHRLLAQAGKTYANPPLIPTMRIRQHNHVRMLTLPVQAELERSDEHTPRPPQSESEQSEAHTLQGYVRVSETTDDLDDELSRLILGLGAGGLTAGILIGGTGWWLTQRSIHPIEQSMRQLKQFTADASHELRSPLATIHTSAEVMQSHPERVHPADQRKLAAIISATQQMSHLVEDLLLLARTDTPAPQTLFKQRIPIDELLEDLVTLLEPQATQQQIQLNLKAPETWIVGDAAKLRRLFLNLLDNALHYTPTGGSIDVLLKASGSTTVIRVRDTGIGIAPDQLSRVFDRFWRADQARSRCAGGSGLGLAIAQAIAHAHGGEITVTSQVGVGSCFQVKLPIGS